MSLKFKGKFYVMTMKNDAKFEGKLICAFKNDMKNLVNFHRLKNRDFILESKMAKLNEGKKIQNKQFEQMQCENFILPWKKMNSTINKTFCTCSTESLFLRYK